jgi:hypothetical protein
MADVLNSLAIGVLTDGGKVNEFVGVLNIDLFELGVKKFGNAEKDEQEEVDDDEDDDESDDDKDVPVDKNGDKQVVTSFG